MAEESKWLPPWSWLKGQAQEGRKGQQAVEGDTDWSETPSAANASSCLLHVLRICPEGDTVLSQASVITPF